MFRFVSSGAVTGLLLVACQPSTTAPQPWSEPLPPPVAASPRKPLTSATEVCNMLFGAPRRHLDGACSVHEEETKAFAQLDELVGKRVDDCVETLKPGMKEGRIRIAREDAEACASEIETTGWRESLRDANIARFASCRDLFSGTQAKGEACGLSIECAAGLVCEKDGKCQPRTAKQCDAPDSWLLGEHAAQCGEAAYCVGTSHEQPSHHLGFSPLGHGARDAAEFGMIGTLNQTAPIGDAFGAGGLGLSGLGEGGSGEGIGLGSVGTIGKPAGTLQPKVRRDHKGVSGRLAPAVIQRIVRQNFGRYRVCYQAGLRDDPNLQGKITVRFVIARDGTVNSVSAKSDMKDKKVVSCVTMAFYSLQFPKPEGGIVTVSYPIIFTPSGDSSDTPKKEPERLTCEPLGEIDESCGHASECASNICRAGRCSDALGRDGDACHADGECGQTLHCGYGSRCRPLLETGKPCDRTAQCEGACIEKKCASLCGAG